MIYNLYTVQYMEFKNYPNKAAINLTKHQVDFSEADDGLPDSWEVGHGLNSFDALDAALDNDSDGSTNLQEFQSGTDPNVSDANTLESGRRAIVPVLYYLLLAD